MSKRIILESGIKYGRLTVIENLEAKKGHARVRCVCDDCGGLSV